MCVCVLCVCECVLRGVGTGRCLRVCDTKDWSNDAENSALKSQE